MYVHNNTAVTLHLFGVGTDCTEGATKREFFFCPNRFLREQTRRKTYACFKWDKWSSKASQCEWETVPCRWRRRRSIVGKSALLARDFKGFQGIFGHPVGFCLHKNIVRIGGLHDGVMLHHTVDTWRRPKWTRVGKDHFTKQTVGDGVCAQKSYQISWKALPRRNRLISLSHCLHRPLSYKSFSSPSERCGGLQIEHPDCVCVSYVCVCPSRLSRSASFFPCVSVG